MGHGKKIMHIQLLLQEKNARTAEFPQLDGVTLKCFFLSIASPMFQCHCMMPSGVARWLETNRPSECWGKCHQAESYWKQSLAMALSPNTFLE